MQYLRYLGQLSYNPILILVMALVGLILSTFVKESRTACLCEAYGNESYGYLDIRSQIYKAQKRKVGKKRTQKPESDYRLKQHLTLSVKPAWTAGSSLQKTRLT